MSEQEETEPFIKEESKEKEQVLRNFKVKTLSNDVYELSVDQNIKIIDLKQKLEQLSKIPVDRQRLVYMGKLLLDQDPLINYVKEDGVVVHLMAKMQNTVQEQQHQQAHQNANNNNQSQNQQQQQRTQTNVIFGSQMGGGQGPNMFQNLIGNLTNALGGNQGQSNNQRSQIFERRQQQQQPQRQQNQGSNIRRIEREVLGNQLLYGDDDYIYVQRRSNLPVHSLRLLETINRQISGNNQNLGNQQQQQQNRNSVEVLGKFMGDYNRQLNQLLPQVQKLSENLSNERNLQQNERQQTNQLSNQIGKAFKEMSYVCNQMSRYLRSVQLLDQPGQFQIIDSENSQQEHRQNINQNDILRNIIDDNQVQGQINITASVQENIGQQNNSQPQQQQQQQQSQNTQSQNQQQSNSQQQNSTQQTTTNNTNGNNTNNTNNNNSNNVNNNTNNINSGNNNQNIQDVLRNLQNGGNNSDVQIQVQSYGIGQDNNGNVQILGMDSGLNPLSGNQNIGNIVNQLVSGFGGELNNIPNINVQQNEDDEWEDQEEVVVMGPQQTDNQNQNQNNVQQNVQQTQQNVINETQPKPNAPPLYDIMDDDDDDDDDLDVDMNPGSTQQQQQPQAEQQQQQSQPPMLGGIMGMLGGGQAGNMMNQTLGELMTTISDNEEVTSNSFLQIFYELRVQDLIQAYMMDNYLFLDDLHEKIKAQITQSLQNQSREDFILEQLSLLEFIIPNEKHQDKVLEGFEPGVVAEEIFLRRYSDLIDCILEDYSNVQEPEQKFNVKFCLRAKQMFGELVFEISEGLVNGFDDYKVIFLDMLNTKITEHCGAQLGMMFSAMAAGQVGNKITQAYTYHKQQLEQQNKTSLEKQQQEQLLLEIQQTADQDSQNFQEYKDVKFSEEYSKGNLK